MRVLLLAPILGLAITSAAAAGGLMDYDTDFCALRAYGEAHMASHPSQTVTGLSISAPKGWNVLAGRDLPYMEPTVALSVTARGRLWDTQLLTCTDYDEDIPERQRADRAHYCRTLCGLGLLRLEVKGDTLTVTALSFPPNCDLPALDRAGDRVFVLKRATPRECGLPPGWPRDEAGLAALKAKMRKAFALD